ncbi:putative metallo-beta-lactamase domain protein [Leptodontidium sp. MPI-SDFR-AT-0119]|nr:putative metallo-beta-lactamase domain protein [Leptodontidium sp. MPI-SDFR-AT-0119]
MVITLQPGSMSPEVYSSFEPVTATWQYIVADPETREAVIIDSVLDFDPSVNRLSTKSADQLLSIISQNGLKPIFIMETHAHADHLTASRYLQQRLIELGHPTPKISIGKRITQVQATFAPKYGMNKEELENVFDHLWDDNEKFKIGCLDCEVLYLPGHTPDHVGYRIEQNVFTGDSIFNPDVGSARADFPGGSATDLYKSARRLLDLPEEYRLYTGHDYPPPEREANEKGEKFRPFTTVGEQKRENKHVKSGVEEETFVKWRRERDATLGEPRLLHQALQFNSRGGRLPNASEGGDRLLHVPLKVDGGLLTVMEGAKL